MKTENSPAFPHTAGASAEHNGMSLRDYFAAKAMNGLLAERGIGGVETLENQKFLAKRCYAVADAMLEASGR